MNRKHQPRQLIVEMVLTHSLTGIEHPMTSAEVDTIVLHRTPRHFREHSAAEAVTPREGERERERGKGREERGERGEKE